MANKLRKLREEKGIDQKKLAQEINTTQQAISLYETGKREPKLKTWEKLANFYHVSVPYIQGFSAVKNSARSNSLIEAQRRYYQDHKEEMKRNMYKSHAKHFITDYDPTDEELNELQALIKKARKE